MTIGGTRTAFMVTDFIEGSTLDRWKPAAFADKLRVATVLAGALAVCHATKYIDALGFQAQGVFHGDIKPSNIMVGANGRPVIIDFLQVDVHRLIDPSIVDPELLTSRSATDTLGTPGFMAPEQERHGIITESTDIYSLGMTLADLFSGSVAWFVARRDVSLELAKLIDGMIAPDPADRPRRMADVNAALAAMA